MHWRSFQSLHKQLFWTDKLTHEKTVGSYSSKYLKKSKSSCYILYRRYDARTRNVLLALHIGNFKYLRSLLHSCWWTFRYYFFYLAYPSEKDYVEKLKLALVELYACLIFSVLSSKNSQYPANKKIVNHFEKLVIFIIKTCDRSQNPTIVECS